jgi:hypothetical protein
LTDHTPEIQSFMADFSPAMWEESKHIIDMIEMTCFGLTGNPDNRELHGMPAFVTDTVLQRIDVMMHRILASHGRIDLLPNWAALLASLSPRSVQPEPLHPPSGDRLPRERRCSRTKPTRKRSVRPC